MKRTYKLYHSEKPEGEIIAIVSDYAQGEILESLYFRVYDNDRFRVTLKFPRKPEHHICGNYII